MAEINDSKNPQSTPPKGPARLMSKDLNVYYSNCAMIAMSPRDISLYYGRFVPASDDKGNQSLAELYERQVYMTIDQAEHIVKLLSQTLDAVKSGRNAVAAQTTEGLAND